MAGQQPTQDPRPLKHARDSCRLTVQHLSSRFTDSFRATMPTTTTTVTASAESATSTVTTTASSPVFPGATKWAAMRSGVVSAPVADVAAFLELSLTPRSRRSPPPSSSTPKSRKATSTL